MTRTVEQEAIGPGPGVETSRRRFVAAAILAAIPLPARSASLPRIGYLSTGGAEQREVFLDALRDGLRELGWEDGRNVVIDVRWVGPEAYRFPEVASEVVKTGPSAFVATCVTSTRAAKGATSTIPVVMAIDGDPVEAKLIASFARPGGNVTGTSTLFEVLIPKWMELIKIAVPAAKAVALVSDPGNLVDPAHSLRVREAAGKVGLGVHEVKVRERADVAPALRGIDRTRVSSVVVMTDALLTSEIATVVPIANDMRLPAIYGYSEFVDAGGLMSYGFSYRQYYGRVARYLDAVLRGAKPAELPVEQPDRFELVLNRPAAARLGLALPAQLLVRADRVVG